jgi:enamine deaminase RidA (YjgF/YER057c/UK114 family)
VSGAGKAAGEGPVKRFGGDEETTRASPVQRLGGDPPSPYEEQFGFSRIVVAGDYVLVGGMTSVDPCGAVLGITGYEQTIEILRKLQHELGRVGCGLGAIVQTRVYVTDISRGEEVGRAFSDVLGFARPLMTMVEVAGLIDPRMLVEVETVAFRR